MITSSGELKEHWCEEKAAEFRCDGTNEAIEEVRRIIEKEMDPEFLAKLQDPTTTEGAWNVFYGLWGTAQSQPGFDHKAWLAVRDYFKKLESLVLKE